MSKHISYADVVSHIAASEWGQQYKNVDHAAKELIGDKEALGAFAIVELLRRLDCLASSLAGNKPQKKPDRIYMPDGADKLPNVNVGDRLYSYDLDDGLAEYLVVAKDDLHRCMIVLVGDFDLEYGPSTNIAASCFETPEEAMRAEAKRFVNDWAGDVENAQKLLHAIETKQPLSEFMQGANGDKSDE